MLLRNSVFACMSLLAAGVAIGQPTLPNVTGVAAPVENFYHSGYGVLNQGVLTGQVVTLGEDGQLIPQAGAEVIISQGHANLTTVTTDGAGVFTLDGMAPGVYELTAVGESSYGANSFQAIEGNGEQVPMHVYSASVPGSVVEQTIMSMWLPGEATARRDEFQVAELSPYRAASRPTVQTPRVKIHGTRVDIQTAYPHAEQERQGLVATIMRVGDGMQQPISVPVGMSGEVSFDVAEAGVFNMVIGGAGYYTAISFEAVADASTGLSMKSANGKRFVGRLQEAANTLLVPLSTDTTAPTGDEPIFEEEPIIEDLGPIVDGGFLPPAGGGGGGFGGGVGGGGSGGGGIGGGLGGIGGAAGLAVGIAALADNDDGFNVNTATGIVP